MGLDLHMGRQTARARSVVRRGLVGAILAAGLLAARAAAGDHHVGGTLRCNQCHVMHFSQGHGYGGGGVGGPGWLGYGPNQGLLRDELNNLCLSCHDGSGQGTDVLGAANGGSQPGTVRLGGYLNRLGLEGSEPTGHTLDSLDSAQGSQPSWRPEDENGLGRGLNCVNCHDPHGRAGDGHPTGQQYRNLRSDVGNGLGLWVTYNETPGTNELFRDVFVRQSRKYDESTVDWNEPDPNRSAIAEWCGGCHNQIHGNSLGGSGGGGQDGSPGFDEHPVDHEDLGNDEVDQYNSHTNRVKVMSEIGNWFPIGQDATPTCITCHRAHGNGNPFGLIYRSGTGTPTEDGDTNGSTRDDLCRQCHLEGAAFG